MAKTTIETLKNESNAIMADIENNSEKYENYFTYAEACERLTQIDTEIMDLQYEEIQEIKRTEAIEQIEDKTVKNIIKKIASKVKYIPCNIIENKDLKKENTQGQYFSETKHIEMARLNNPGTLIHEIGHHIHDLINNMEALRIPTTTDYSKTNQMEGFAEAFRYYVLNPNMYPKATAKMDSILREYNLLV